MKSNQTNPYKPHLLLGKTNKQNTYQEGKRKKNCDKKYTLNTEKLQRNKKEQTKQHNIYNFKLFKNPPTARIKWDYIFRRTDHFDKRTNKLSRNESKIYNHLAPCIKISLC